VVVKGGAVVVVCVAGVVVYSALFSSSIRAGELVTWDARTWLRLHTVTAGNVSVLACVTEITATDWNLAKSIIRSLRLYAKTPVATSAKKVQTSFFTTPKTRSNTYTYIELNFYKQVIPLIYH
jgi:hypothetical protein